jgi:hypothetical protein
MTKKISGLKAQLVLALSPALSRSTGRGRMFLLVLGIWSFVGHWDLVIDGSPDYLACGL